MDNLIPLMLHVVICVPLIVPGTISERSPADPNDYGFDRTQRQRQIFITPPLPLPSAIE